VSRPAFRHQSAEIVVAALFLALGALVMWDSVRLGARWAEDGPQAGYFPFYIGLLVCVASAANIASAFFLGDEKNRTFVETHQLALVLVVLVPAATYVALIGWLGIYVSSALYIGFFMSWLGKYPWWKVAAVSVGTSAVFFLIFEVWFLVPLPKGPLESALGVG
jgi:putative tricarboxylic transport membrane protein